MGVSFFCDFEQLICTRVVFLSFKTTAGKSAPRSGRGALFHSNFSEFQENLGAEQLFEIPEQSNARPGLGLGLRLRFGLRLGEHRDAGTVILPSAHDGIAELCGVGSRLGQILADACAQVASKRRWEPCLDTATPRHPPPSL